MRHQPAGGNPEFIRTKVCTASRELQRRAANTPHMYAVLPPCGQRRHVGTVPARRRQTYGQAQASRVTAAQRPRGVPSAVKRGSALYLDVVPIHHWTQQRVVDLAPPD